MTTNQQRAALTLAEIEQYVDVRGRQHILTAVLAAAEARGRADALREVAKPECPLSERVDGPLHSWRFGGDDPCGPSVRRLPRSASGRTTSPAPPERCPPQPLRG